MIIVKGFEKVVLGPDCKAKGHGFVLKEHIFICPYFHFCCLLLHCCTSPICLLCPDHIDQTFVPSNLRHDIAHVCRIHRDVVLCIIEWIQHFIEEIDPFLNCAGMSWSLRQVLVWFTPVDTDMNFVRCQWPFCNAEWMYCWSSADWLWIWNTSDRAMIPPIHYTLVKREPFPECYTFLPPIVECILDVPEFAAVPR